MTTYYVDTAADTGGDGTTQDLTGIHCAFKTIAAAQAAITGSRPDDSLLFKRGCIWREKFTVGAYGTAGHPFTIGAYGSVAAGAYPYIYGSTQVSTWSDEGSNIWSAACTADPVSVWFVLPDGSAIWGTERASLVTVTAEYDWYWSDADDKLYVYATSDPDSRYTSVEKPTRDSGVYSNSKDYVTVSYLDIAFCFSGSDARAVWTNFADNNIIEYCNLHHNGDLGDGSNPQGNGTYCYASDKIILRYNTSYENARRGLSMFAGSGFITDPVIEGNTSYNNYHSQCDVFGNPVSTADITGLIMRYNHFYTDENYGAHGKGKLNCQCALLKGDGIYITGQVYYNIFERNYNTYGLGLEYNTGTEIYNNLFYGTATGATTSPGLYAIDNNNSGLIIKNNIGVDCKSGCLKIYNISDVAECDNNLWYQSAGGTEIYVYAGGTSYHFDDFAAYKSATGWDTNGLWEDPLFFDASNRNFRLTPSSPCIDTGEDVGLTRDIDGVTIY